MAHPLSPSPPRSHHREFVLVSNSLGMFTPSGDPLKQMLALSLFAAMVVIITCALSAAVAHMHAHCSLLAPSTDPTGPATLYVLSC
jgi:hypothetical protein